MTIVKQRQLASRYSTGLVFHPARNKLQSLFQFAQKAFLVRYGEQDPKQMSAKIWQFIVVAYWVVNEGSSKSNQVEFVSTDKGIGLFNSIVVIGHEQGRTSWELDELAKVKNWIVSFRKWIALRSPRNPVDIFIAGIYLNSATANVDDANLAAYQLSDEIRIRLFHLIELNHRVVEVICGFDFDANYLGSSENLSNGIDHLQGKAASILDRPAIFVSSMIGTAAQRVSKLVVFLEL